jgi:hypothetical protein
LDAVTIFSLVSARNFKHLLLVYAQIGGDYERVVDLCFTEGKYIDIIKILNDAPVEKVEHIIYRLAPNLVEFEAESTFDMLFVKPKLRLASLMPTIVRYCSLLDDQQKSTAQSPFPVDIDYEGRKTNFAVKFLQDSLQRNLDEVIFDPSLIYILSSLLAKYDDTESQLFPFIESLSKLYQNKIHQLDKEFILRQCQFWKRRKSTVAALLLLGNEEVAVDQAILFDVEWAKDIALRSNPQKSKSLLLKILKYLVTVENDVLSALHLLSQSGGIVLIEVLVLTSVPLEIRNLTLLGSFASSTGLC